MIKQQSPWPTNHSRVLLVFLSSLNFDRTPDRHSVNFIKSSLIIPSGQAQPSSHLWTLLLTKSPFKMGKITFYCAICSGPLYEWGLRKASTAQPGDDENGLFDDDCECSDQSDDDEDGEDNEDPAKHTEYCPYSQGYWGDILSEGDIAVQSAFRAKIG